MFRTGPIVVIEDDPDDLDLFVETFASLGYPNKVIYFTNGNDALEYLVESKVPPVVIISDINMPEIDGFEIKKRINQDKQLQKWQIPFVFFTTSAQHRSVVDAYSLSVQGYFLKPNNIEDLRNTMKTMVDYWLRSYAPTMYVTQAERPCITMNARDSGANAADSIAVSA